MTIELTEEEVRELESDWNVWSDESYCIHAAYILRAALIRAGWKEKDDEFDNPGQGWGQCI